jgi:hypothetical protein
MCEEMLLWELNGKREELGNGDATAGSEREGEGRKM